MGWLATYQPFAASVIGLLALIGGALLNAHLNRRRDDREAWRQDRRIANALFAEAINTANKCRSSILILNNAIAGQLNVTFASCVQFAPPKSHLLEKLDDNIGRLPTQLATMLVNLAQNVYDIRENFTAQTANAVAGKYAMNPLPPEYLTLYRDRLQQIVTIVDFMDPLMAYFASEERPNFPRDHTKSLGPGPTKPR